MPSDHLAARGADVDFQIWIAQGEQPLIQRVVLTYKLEKGAPQFWAEFSDWNFNPAVPASKFEFQPPTDAKPIQFLAQYVETERTRQEPAAQKGEMP